MTNPLTRRLVRFVLVAIGLLIVACGSGQVIAPASAPSLPVPTAGVVQAAPLEAAGTRTYFTKFPTAENPISEGGNWLNGGTAGLDWTNVATTQGRAFGTQSGNSASVFDDSIAMLSGSWGNDQAAVATVYVNPIPTKCCPEVELHLRRTIQPHYSGGYEFTCSVTPASTYMGIVRWPGAIGTSLDSFVTVAGRNDMGCADGDVLAATAVGSTLTFYKNGTPVLSGTDTTYTGGAPGIGFFLAYQTGIISNWGFTNFAANDAGVVPDLQSLAAAS